jgi:endonuclease-8
MPEGDTLFRAARTLHLALAGRTVTRFESVLPKLLRVHEDAPLTGRTVEGARARGKHLLLRFSGGLTLRTHLRMSGSWHLYRPGERWRRPRSAMRVVVATDAYEAVAFDVPVAELLDDAALARQSDLRRLGPDLSASAYDAEEAERRFRAEGAREVAEVLLDQSVVAGAGNVFKSEVLFVAGVDPFRRVADLSDAEARRVLAEARRLLVANRGADLGDGGEVHSGGRRTTGSDDPGQRLFVYARSGEPCRRCGTPVRYARQGPHARGTYWCPGCQT